MRYILLFLILSVDVFGQRYLETDDLYFTKVDRKKVFVVKVNNTTVVIPKKILKRYSSVEIKDDSIYFKRPKTQLDVLKESNVLQNKIKNRRSSSIINDFRFWSNYHWFAMTQPYSWYQRYYTNNFMYRYGWMSPLDLYHNRWWAFDYYLYYPFNYRWNDPFYYRPYSYNYYPRYYYKWHHHDHDFGTDIYNRRISTNDKPTGENIEVRGNRVGRGEIIRRYTEDRNWRRGRNNVDEIPNIQNPRGIRGVIEKVNPRGSDGRRGEYSFDSRLDSRPNFYQRNIAPTYTPNNRNNSRSSSNSFNNSNSFSRSSFSSSGGFSSGGGTVSAGSAGGSSRGRN
tara:strand:+ start:1674 stop:2690 length:1017 start_codon:yes stop_codon:yes gene_type:complete